MFNRYFQRKAVAMIMVAACVASLTACGGDKVTKNQENTTAVTAATTQAAQESTTVQEETSSRSMEEARAAAEKVRQAKGQIDSEITNQENVGSDGQADGTGSDTAGASDAAAVAQKAQEAQEAVAAAVSSSIGKDEQVVTVVDTVGVNSARAQYNANYAAYVELIRLTNELRASLGVAPLKMDETFCIAACKKATDYHLNNFYDGENHAMIDGRIWKSIFTDFGISSTARAENLARGQKTAQEMFNDWKNSPIHYENMVNPVYTRVGVGSCGYTWFQLFAD
ncbi:MAG: CAP domain-containing protein [Lachnospira sp.]|nr:CAP domain-containing protein [Lachnospira sp.]